MKIALIQMTSVLDYKINLEKIDSWLAQAKIQNATHVFLPESFYSFSNGIEVTPYFLAPGNSHENHIKALAKKHRLNLWGGSCIYKIGNNYLNRALFINEQGEIINHYDKMHLFYFNNTTPGQVSHDEASKYKAGNSLTFCPWDKEWLLGASICYDVRFPELYRKYSTAGANVLTVASAFTIPTGQAHWHNLLKARAIENLSFVIASAQWGKHNDRISTFGHSLIVSPWGEILVDMKEGEGLQVCDLDIQKVKEARTKLSNLWSNFLM
jgi:predicted amidohydrolase